MKTSQQNAKYSVINSKNLPESVTVFFLPFNAVYATTTETKCINLAGKIEKINWNKISRYLI
jgi:hypothetical protein